MAIKLTSITNTDVFGTTVPYYRANAGDRTTVEMTFTESISFRSSQSSPVTTSALLRSENKLRFANYVSLNGFAIGQNVTLVYTGPQGQTETLNTTITAIDYLNFIVTFAAYFSGAAQNKDLFDASHVLDMRSPDLRSDFYISLNFSQKTLSGKFDSIASTTENSFLGVVSAYRPSQIDGIRTYFYADTTALAVGGSVNLSQQGKKSGMFDVLNPVLYRLADSGNERVYKISIEIFQPGIVAETSESWNNSGFYFDLEWYSISAQAYHPTVVQWFILPPESGWLGEAYGGGIPGNNLPNSQLTQAVTNPIYYDSDTTHTVKIATSSTDISMIGIYYPIDDYNKNNYKSQAELLMSLETYGGLVVANYTSNESSLGVYYEIEVTIFNLSAGVYTIEFTFKPTAAFAAFMESRGEGNQRFRLVFGAGNTNHIAFDGDLLRTPNPTELLNSYKPAPATNWAFYETDSPNKTYGAEGGLGNGGARVSIADNIRLRAFSALPKFKRYQKLTFEVVAAERLNLDNRFQLEFLEMDLTQSPYDETTGITNFGVSAQKSGNLLGVQGFDLARLFRLSPYPDELGRFQVQMVFPYLIDWRYWINEPNAFAQFYPNQNRNYNNYDSATFGIFLRILIEAEDVNFEHFAPIDTIKAYNETFNDVPEGEEWQGSAIIEYFDESGVQQPVLIYGQQMTVKVTVDTNQPIGVSPGDFWGQLTIEPLESSPRYALSSNYDYVATANTVLVPLAGQTKLKATRVTANQATFEAVVNTSLLGIGDYTTTLKFMNLSTPLEQVRLSFSTKLKLGLSTEFIIDGKIKRECCGDFLVYADSTGTEDYKNAVTSAWFKTLGEGDTIDFELYDEHGNLTSWQPSKVSFPNDADAFYAYIFWKSVLVSDGLGQYELRLKYTDAYSNVVYSAYGVYNLIPWSLFNLSGYVVFTGIFDDFQEIYNINFKGSQLIDTIAVPGLFGNKQPDKQIDNVTKVNGEQIKISRDNENKYTFTSAPIEDNISTRLSNVFFLSETNLLITDYNDFNHKDYTKKQVIVSESDEYTYFDASNKAVVTCTFRDKFRNQRSR